MHAVAAAASCRADVGLSNHPSERTAEESRLAKARSASKKGSQSKGKKEKAVKLKDYQRNALLAGVHNQDSEQDVTAGPSGFRTHAQEEEDLRRETKAAFLQAVDVDGDDDEDGEADDEDGDGLLVRRDAREDSAEEEEDQYRRFLLENVGQAEMDRALAIQAENKRKTEASEEGDEAPKKSDDDFLKKCAWFRTCCNVDALYLLTVSLIHAATS